jgi:hypothetical protein
MTFNHVKSSQAFEAKKYNKGLFDISSLDGDQEDEFSKWLKNSRQHLSSQNDFSLGNKKSGNSKHSEDGWHASNRLSKAR